MHRCTAQPSLPPIFGTRRVRWLSCATLLLFLSACGDGIVPLPNEPLDPADPADPAALDDPEPVGTEVSDGENGGTAGFYFLPPLAEDVDRTGPFDATLLDRLSVVICRLADTECSGDPVAVFTGGNGAADHALRVSGESGAYRVNWHTGSNDTKPGRYRIIVLVDSTELGHADVQLVDGRGPGRGQGAPSGALQIGRSLPIRFLVGAGVVPAFTLSVTEDPDVGPLVLGLDVDVVPAAVVTVDYWTDVGPRLRVTSPAAETHHVLLSRLFANRTYDYEVRASSAAMGTTAPSADAMDDAFTGTFQTDTLPTDLAAVGLTATGASTSPLVMLELRVPTFQGFAAVDTEGRVVWYHRTTGSSWGWTRRANGDFVFLDTGDVLNEVTPAGVVVATLPNLSGQVIHHDVIATPQNTLYFMTRSAQTVDGTSWVGEKIWEWTPEDGTVVERWNAFDFLSPTTDVSPLSRSSDWLHGNSLNIGASGNILLSSPFLDQVIAITPDFSALAWRLGGVNATIQPDSASTFAFQHTASEIAPGHVLVFDNRGRGTYSRALELELDPAAGTATTAWEFRPPNDNLATIISSARRMANGNTMVAFGTSDGWRGSVGPIEVYEVEPDGTVIWHLVVTGPDHMYRATPFDDIAGEVVVTN